MRYLSTAIVFFFYTATTLAQQNVGIGTNTPAASSIVEIKSNTKGLLIPRTSTSSRQDIANPAKGLLMYDTTAGNFYYHNGIAWVVIQGGDISATHWSTTGNVGTFPPTNFLGTTDNAPLAFKVNNLPTGKLTTNGSVYLGLNSGTAATTAFSNVGIGNASLKSNTYKSNLVAIGDSALFNNGTNVFHDDIQALSNVAVGSKALYANATGSWNTAVGSNALKSNVGYLNTIESNLPVEYEGGNGNTAIGANALQSNNYGLYNTALGANALISNTGGSDNTAAGFMSLNDNITGHSNVGYGTATLQANQSGNYNTAIGHFAGANNLSGSNNIFIGSGAGPNISNAASSQLNIGNWIYGYNGNIGLGITNPTSKLSVGSNGIELLGTAMNGTFKTNAGDLSTSFGANMGIANIGFKASGNNTSLGIRAYRFNGANPGWSGTSILLQYDVDNTVQAAGATGYFALCANGNFGVGTAIPSEKLEVVGNVKANNVLVPSDARFKRDISTVPDALHHLLQLRGANYFYNTEAFPDMNFSSTKQLGVIAQEIETIFPELVITSSTGYKSVNYMGLIPVLIESVKEQQKMIQQQQEQIDALLKMQQH